MVKVVERTSRAKKFKRLTRSPFFIPVTLIALVLLSFLAYFFLSSQRQQYKSKAASGPTATIQMSPATGTFGVGQSFSVDLVIDGGGQAFNAAQAVVSLSSNLTASGLSLISPSSGGCNFTFATAGTTPTASNPSFSGAILNGSATQCKLYTLTITPNAAGSGVITISGGSVKAYSDSSEIFQSSTNGNYMITSATPTPTGVVPTPTPIPPNSVLSFSPLASTVTADSTLTVQVRVNTGTQMVNAFQTGISYPTSLLSVASVVNTGAAFEVEAVNKVDATNGVISLASGTTTPKSGDLLLYTITFNVNAPGTAAVDFVNPVVASSISNADVLKSFSNASYTINAVVTPTPTPTPAAVTPTPTPAQSVQVPTINSTPAETYDPAVTLTGGKATNVVAVLVNATSMGVSYPTPTTWQYAGRLATGKNTFTVVGQDASGNNSTSTSVSIVLHRLGDEDGDGKIDLTDISIFGSDWGKTGNFNNPLSDMNDDGVVNLTDFSIIAKAYGN